MAVEGYLSGVSFIRQVEFSHTVLHQKTDFKEPVSKPIAVTGFSKNVNRIAAGPHQVGDQVTGKGSKKRVCRGSDKEVN